MSLATGVFIWTSPREELDRLWSYHPIVTPRLSTLVWMPMCSSPQVPLRQAVCGWDACRAIFHICRSCDRGQRYCSDSCQQQARQRQRRQAKRRHQQSPEGRQDHRDHQRTYRQRLLEKKSVSDQGSATTRGCASIGLPPAKAQPGAPFRWIRPVWDKIKAGWGEILCRFCGMRGRFANPYCLKGAP